MSITSSRWSLLLAGLLLAPFSTPASAQQDLTFTPFHANGIYQPGEKVGWTVTRSNAAAGPTRFAYDITKNELEVLRSGTLDLSSGTATIEAISDEACMLFVELRPEGASPAPGGPQRRPYASVGAAVAPDRLQPSVPRPADFDEFWASKLKAMRAIPLDPVLTPMASDVPGVEVSAVKVTALNSSMQGYVVKPQREGKFPALVTYQGAGVRALRPDAAAARAAEGWLVVDVDSHDKAPDASTGPPSNYHTIGNTDREQSYFLNMYLRDTRAIDYIVSRPDWDGKTIVILGTSMGGQQGIVTAALNPDRITALLVNEPSGGDANGELHGRSAAYPNWPANDPKAMQAALYFDTVNFASLVKAPTLISMGFIDTVVPPAGVWIALNQIPAPKEVVPMLEANHVHITPNKVGAFAQRSTEVLGLLLGGVEFKPNQEITGGGRQDSGGTPASQSVTTSRRPAISPERQEQLRKAKEEQLHNDWAEMKRYRDDDAKVGPPAKGENRVVFMGDSITDGWIRQAPEFFQAKPYLDRGISGQTSPQMLVRFRQDVVNLHPRVVVILAGTNDIAGNTGPETPEMIQDNLVSMVDLARANGIRVVLASITPSDDFWWNPGTKPAPRIAEMNTWIKGYAAQHKLVYLDYYSAMVDDNGGMKREFTRDGVHPNPEGYAVMGKLAEEAIASALAGKSGK
jgi:cephalosporin-C deacetylase-like acetyl esterase/lysophospholipase L1-like esterase